MGAIPDEAPSRHSRMRWTDITSTRHWRMRSASWEPSKCSHAVVRKVKTKGASLTEGRLHCILYFWYKVLSLNYCGRCSVFRNLAQVHKHARAVTLNDYDSSFISLVVDLNKGIVMVLFFKHIWYRCVTYCTVSLDLRDNGRGIRNHVIRIPTILLLWFFYCKLYNSVILNSVNFRYLRIHFLSFLLPPL
jgi:hypothetical protein